MLFFTYIPLYIAMNETKSTWKMVREKKKKWTRRMTGNSTIEEKIERRAGRPNKFNLRNKTQKIIEKISQRYKSKSGRYIRVKGYQNYLTNLRIVKKNYSFITCFVNKKKNRVKHGTIMLFVANKHPKRERMKFFEKLSFRTKDHRT